MKGLWLENGQISVRNDLAEPVKSGAEDVIVTVLSAGICNTDLELIKGYYPYTGVLGHEFVGRVDDVEAPVRLRGKHVVAAINVVCHNCRMCRMNLEKHCERRSVVGIVNRGGVFTERIALPAENLIVLPDGVQPRHACFAEPLAAALEIHEQVTMKSTDKVLVIGDGKLGLLIAQTIRLTTDCDLTIVGRHARNMALLDHWKDVKKCTDAEKLMDSSFDIAVECSGNNEAFVMAERLLRSRGTLIMKSTYHGSLTINAAAIVVNELTIVGSRCGPMEKAVEWLSRSAKKEDKSRRLNLTGMIDKTFSLDDALKAIDAASTKGVLKVQIDVEST